LSAIFQAHRSQVLAGVVSTNKIAFCRANFTRIAPYSDVASAGQLATSASAVALVEEPDKSVTLVILTDDDILLKRSRVLPLEGAIDWEDV